MRVYRVFLFDAENLAWTETFVAEADERALAEAETMFTIRTQYVAFELWQRERLIQRGDRKAP